MYYDPTLTIKLTADASAFGVRVVISHRMPDGTERPLIFASHPLTANEKNYAHLETKALSWYMGQEIPPISLWSKIYFTHRPSTTENNF